MVVVVVRLQDQVAVHKSLSHMLKGKQGPFRQTCSVSGLTSQDVLLSPLVPLLKMYQCGVPREMAIELFKPFVMHEIVARDIVQNVKAAKRLVERGDERIWDILEEVIKGTPSALEPRTDPSPFGIQAFEPVLIDGRLFAYTHWSVEAYNADFDGDQIAIHVPLSEEAQAEARILMLAAEHILNPKDGKPVVTPYLKIWS